MKYYSIGFTARACLLLTMLWGLMTADATVNYPSNTPPWEQSWWVFNSYFSNMFTVPCQSGRAVQGFTRTGVIICTGDALQAGALTGSLRGTDGRIPKWSNGGTLLMGSVLFETWDNIGLWTINPQAKLDVRWMVQAWSIDTNQMLRLSNGWTGYPDSTLWAEISNDTATYKSLMIVGNRSAGIGKRKVWIWDDLSVEWNLSVVWDTVISGNLTLPNGAFRAKKGAPNNADTSTNGYAFEADGDTGLFAVGGSAAWGSDLTLYNDNTERMRIASNGNMGIGTSVPSYKLDVNGDTITNWLRTRGTTGWYNETYGGGWYMFDTSWIRSYGNKNVWIDQTLWVNGNVGIWTWAPAYKLDVQGNARVTGTISASNFYYTSDMRLKNDIRPILDPLQKIQQLNGYTFNWKNNGQADIGLIAQEVEKVFPELVGTWVDTAGNTYKTVKYGNIVAPIIAAIKELSSKLDYQEKRMDEQEKRIEILMKKIEEQDKLIRELQQNK